MSPKRPRQTARKASASKARSTSDQLGAKPLDGTSNVVDSGVAAVLRQFQGAAAGARRRPPPTEDACEACGLRPIFALVGRGDGEFLCTWCVGIRIGQAHEECPERFGPPPPEHGDSERAGELLLVREELGPLAGELDAVAKYLDAADPFEVGDCDERVALVAKRLRALAGEQP